MWVKLGKLTFLNQIVFLQPLGWFPIIIINPREYFQSPSSTKFKIITTGSQLWCNIYGTIDVSSASEWLPKLIFNIMRVPGKPIFNLGNDFQYKWSKPLECFQSLALTNDDCFPGPKWRFMVQNSTKIQNFWSHIGSLHLLRLITTIILNRNRVLLRKNRFLASNN